MRAAADPLMDKFTRFDSQAAPRAGVFGAVEAVLKTPGSLVRELGRPDGTAAVWSLRLLAVAVALSAAYGAVLGLYQPGLQTLWASLKVPIVVVGSALLCTPTLFVFNSLAGSRLTFPQTLGVALAASASIALLLTAFAPVVWFFGVSTRGFGFMSFLHLLVFAFAVGFGLQRLWTIRSYLAYLNGAETIWPGVLFAWSMILVLVGLQMAYYLRPLLLAGPFCTGERGLFLEFLAPPQPGS